MSGGGTKNALGAEQKRRLANLTALPDSLIDNGDIPEAPPENGQQARRPGMFRALKQPVANRADTGMLHGLRKNLATAATIPR